MIDAALLGGETEGTLEPLAELRSGWTTLIATTRLIDQVKGVEDGRIDAAAAAWPELDSDPPRPDR